MSQTYVKNRQTRQIAQPRVTMEIAQQVVKTQPISQTHEPIVIFSREMLQNRNG